MVDTAIDSTITIPVAADRPPTNTSSASASRWPARGKVSTKVSGSTPLSPK